MNQDRAARGKTIRDQAFGKDGLKTWDELNAICPTHAQAIHEYCFGTIWDRPHLDLKTRELLVIAAAVASDCTNEVALHARGALNRGAERGSRARAGLGREHVQQQVECGRGKGMHVAEAIAAAGFERDCALASSG